MDRFTKMTLLAAKVSPSSALKQLQLNCRYIPRALPCSLVAAADGLTRAEPKLVLLSW
jgi:hypothetical protein